MRDHGPHAAAVSCRGFTLVELLVASLVVLAIAGALSGLATTMHRSFDRSLAAGELAARGRSGVSAVVADLRDAGTGVAIGDPLRPVADVVPVVVPARSLTDRRVAQPFTAVTTRRAIGGQALLRERAVSGSTSLQLDSDAPSVDQDGTGGFRRGDMAIVFDATRAESIVIAGVIPGPWTLSTMTPLRNTFERGAVVIAEARTSFGLASVADGTLRVVRVSSGGAAQPLVDSVRNFEFVFWAAPDPPNPLDPGALMELTAAMLNDGPWLPDPGDPEAFDADLLRVKRVDVRLRVEALTASLRASVPDLDLSASVTLRSR